MDPQQKQKYIECLKIVVQIQEMGGLQFRTESEKQIYLQVLQEYKKLEQIKAQVNRLNEDSYAEYLRLW